jgi:hypothetical protein
MKNNWMIAHDTSALFLYSAGMDIAGFGHNNSDMTFLMIKRIIVYPDSGTIHATSGPIPDRSRISIP